MRSIWKGSVSFGLVTIPVKAYSATEQHDVAFHQVHRADGGRIRFKRVCALCGQEVPYAEVAKGYELPNGEVVVLTDEDFADLPLATSHRIEVVQFTPADRVDPILFAKSYYLEPDASGVKAYVVLREALERSGKVAIVKVAMRQRETLATLRARDGVFVMETMLWPDEVRPADFAFLQEKVDVQLQELRVAESLIEEMTGEFDPAGYTDTYREALQRVIEAKVEGRQVVRPEGPVVEGAPAADLMAALRASVEAAKQGRAAAQAPEAAAESPEAAQAAGGGRRRARTARGGSAASGSGRRGAGGARKEPGTRRPRKTA